MIIHETNILRCLQDQAATQGDHVAFVFLNNGEEEKASLTFGDLDAKAQKIAAYLQQYANIGDRILLAFLPGLDFISAFIGCLYAGMIAVPTYPLRNNHHTQRTLAILHDCDPKLILGADKSLEFMQQIPEFSAYHYVLTNELQIDNKYTPIAITSDMLVFLQYTSGSTASPKGVMISHSNLLANLQAIHNIYRGEPGDILISWLPMQHDMGLIGQALYTIYSGIKEIIMSPNAFLEKPVRWLNAINHYQGAAIAAGGPNFAYQLCADVIATEQLQGLNLSDWQVAFNGSEPIRAETIQQFLAKFSSYGFRPETFLPTYGMAEATLLISSNLRGKKPIIKKINKSALQTGRFEEDPQSNYELVSSGFVDKSYILKIVNPETSKEAIENEIGEIWISGPSVARGYWNKSDETKEIFRARLPNDKNYYLRTGDLGYLDGENLFVTGRLKDLIILRGLNIYPQDIEIEVENSHPAIRKGSTAAFSVEINNAEQLIIVTEIKLSFRKKNFAPIFSAIRQSVLQTAEVIPYRYS